MDTVGDTAEAWSHPPKMLQVTEASVQLGSWLWIRIELSGPALLTQKLHFPYISQ